MAKPVTLETLHEQQQTMLAEQQAMREELRARGEQQQAMRDELRAQGEQQKAMREEQREMRQVLRQHDVRFDKLETDVHQLQGAVGELQDRTAALDDRVTEGFAYINGRLDEVLVTTRALTSAVTQTLSDLALSRSYDRRLTALESAVFGKPQS